MESLISAPCLLDDLMDTGLVSVDINFGQLGGSPKEDDVLKKSPSHDSDSGVSIMSSPQHSSVSEFEDDTSFTAFSPPGFENMDLFDMELSNYLTGETNNNDATDDVSSILSVSPVMSPNTGHRYQHQISNESQTTDSEILQTMTASSSKCEIRTKSNTASSRKCETRAKSNTATLLPTVKVIKVITAPKSVSKIQMERDIIEAIDEKNMKNAKQAKINREKKKVYMKSLEDEVDSLKFENATLKDKMGKLEHHKNSLQEEVEYLKSVLANQSTLSNLLKNIPNANVKLSSSFIHCKRGADHDHDYQRQTKSAKKTKTAGVCLHVENENVSLEFCSSCSKNAQESCS